MPRRRQPRYPLSAVKAAFSDVNRLNRTMSATEGAEELQMDEFAVVDLIAALTADDFDKSMLSEVDLTTWQDVYKPFARGREFYVKFTLDGRGEFLLISFKRNDL